MKADATQQSSLLELSQVDAELARLGHRAAHLPERETHARIRGDHSMASDRLAALQIALEDLDAQVTRFEAEIDAVRQREDRDRSLLDSGAAGAKQVVDLQHELETLQRRQASLEDSLLEVLEQREQLQARQASESAAVESLRAELAGAGEALDGALAGIEEHRRRHSARRDELAAALNPELLSLYERQRATGGVGAGPLRGRQCGACRIEIDRGGLARILAAGADDVLRCPECGAILLRVEDNVG